MSLTSAQSDAAPAVAVVLPSDPEAANAPVDALERVSDSIASGVVFALLLTVGQRIIGFARGILFCRLMTDQELGQWSMVWSVLMLLAPLAVFGLPGCFGRYTEYYRNRGQLGTFVLRIWAITLVMTLVVAGALLAAPRYFSWLIFRDPTQVSIIVSLAIALVVVSISNFLSSLMESLRQVRAVTWMRFITGFVFATVGIGMIVAMKDRSAAAALGYAVSCVLGSIPALWFLWKYRADISNNSGDHLKHTDMWKRIAPFAAWLWASNLFHNMFEVSDRYMLIHWSNAAADIAQGYVGQYHSGRVIPLLMVSVAAVLSGLLMPYMSAAWEKGERELTCRQLNWSIKILAMCCTAGGIFVIMLAPLLFETVFQGRYNDGLAVLPMTMVYCVWFSLFIVGQNYLWVAEKGKWAALVLAIGLAINVVLNIVLIPRYGLTGAVIATTLGNLSNLLLIYWCNNHFGCRTDIGIWASTIAPLLMLLPVSFSVAGFAVLTVIAWRTNWFFGIDEKADIRELAMKARAKLGLGN